ncbi:hypothetical protein AAFC00_002608 [Neodothiora populina]|uniref:Uncharacterized protein n=1 Tax=Neodothiora populina TaxID=2781224 RepID=A0ABR3P7M1_9PEZI
MHDLKKREFSLRRYCRDSGREVCHSVRKYREPAIERRPHLGRSLSTAFAAMKSDGGKVVTTPKLKRSDSGYESINSSKFVERDAGLPAMRDLSSTRHTLIPTNTTKLEFANYSQVEVKRRGTRSNKRYEFEYWGTEYVWKRIVDKSGPSEGMLYYLHRAGDSRVLARIEPCYLTSVEADEEESKGGWIPPCVMQIDDETILQDQTEASDVVVASGLIALADDCIKQRFHPQMRRQFLIPVPKFRVDVDYVGTKTLWRDMLHRPSTLRSHTHEW